jgi:hypothetical protein
MWFWLHGMPFTVASPPPGETDGIAPPLAAPTLGGTTTGGGAEPPP